MNRLDSYQYSTANTGNMSGIAGFVGKFGVHDMAYLSL